MTEPLKQAIASVRDLPEFDQDLAGELLFSIMAKRIAPVPLDEKTRLAVREGVAQAERGEFAGDEEMAAFFARHWR